MGPAVKVEDDSFAEFTRDVLGRCWGEGDFKVVVEETWRRDVGRER